MTRLGVISSIAILAALIVAVCVVVPIALGSEPEPNNSGRMQIKAEYLESASFKEALKRAESDGAPKPDPKRFATCMAAFANEKYCKVHWKSFVAEPGSPEALKAQEGLRRSLEAADRILANKIAPLMQEGENWADLERTVGRKRFAACIAAFGDTPFCECLNANLHWILDFETYIRVITAPNAQPDPLSKTEEQQVINSVFRAREKCVSAGS